MKIAVCEDDMLERRLIKSNLEKALKDIAAEAEIECFANAKELEDKLRKGKVYQLYLLDIIMGEEKNGIELAREISARDSEAKIAFLTSSKGYALDAFEVGAIHYLIKPVTERAVKAILERWKVKTEYAGDYLEIHAGRETRKFIKSQILYIRSKDRGVEIHMKSRKWDTWMKYPFQSMEEVVKDLPQFTKIGRGCIVNLDYVSRIEYTECTLTNGEVLPISRREQNEVLKKYNDYLFWKMEQDEKWGM